MYFGNLGTYFERHAPFGNHPTLTTELVVYWPLNETSGTRFDILRTHPLTSNGGVGYASGKSGNAASLVAASSQYLSGSAIAELNDQWTVSIWAKYNGFGTAPGGWFFNGTGELDMGLYIVPDVIAIGDVGVFLPPNSIATTTLIYSGGSLLTSGAFNHIVARYDGTNSTPSNRPTLNINGVSVNFSVTGTPPASVQIGSGMQLGRGLTVNDKTTGLVDEIAVWSRVITDAECSALYDSGNGLFY